ncbi:MAG TPA: lipoprotein-releasing ABC transporter permease subunit [Methylomirabilota bacterium]|jgi:lipoprotein-releasing system permease protein|nr:lipoprotein-releasing ABC transporter permease subunit [Methylomirabilota bacterium]
MIFGAFERMVAMRYLRARRQEGFISVIAGFSLLGIALGVATLIIVMSVMNGFRHELLSRILGLNGHMAVYAELGPVLDYEGVAERLSKVRGVVQTVPTVEGQVMATAHGGATGALVRGVRPEDLAKRKVVSDHIVAGTLDRFKGDDAILVGSRLAQRFGLGIGSQLTLISPQGNPTAFGTVPRIRGYTIIGIFEVGMYEYDSTFIFMPLEAAQKFFRLPAAVTNVEVMVGNPDMVGALAGPVLEAAGPGHRLVDWQRANSTFFNAIQVERNVMFLILTLIILVAAFNIISGQIMLVKDKGRDIAILRTMGATRGMVLRIFLLSGASIGIVGTLIGFALGVLFADNIETIRQWLQGLTGTELFSAEIYFLSQLPAIIEPGEVAAVVLMALALSLLATVYPSWRAARLDPVEALRYE